ncbi:MAG TPA: hypothetical protein VEH80_05275 [Candidatus Bathyarchaeia archaeon]|nr:hypothetical protein [Candidatus Bathyarchaeia archaeon]
MPSRRPVSRVIEDFCGALFFHRSGPRPDLTGQLRAEARALPDLPVITDDVWLGKREQLRQLLLSADPSDFLRWEPIRTTMFKRGRGPVAHELRHLRRRPDWKTRWRPAIRDWTVGHPRPFHLHVASSPNVIHLAYHLCRFEEATGFEPATAPFVVEFGGGYGGMCRLLHRLGFAGTYVIFDLPEVAVLQRFVLRHAGIPVRDGGPDVDGTRPGVVTTSDPAVLRALVHTRAKGPAAFIATWSLSESPLELRRIVLGEVAGFDAFLVGYKEHYEGIDNRREFAAWRATLLEHAWHEESIPHLRKAEWYLFGVRR